VPMKFVVVFLLSVFMLSGCSSTQSDEQVITEAWKIEDLKRSEAFWTPNNFYEDLERYKEFGCGPKLEQLKFARETKSVPLWGSYVEMKEANIFIDGYPTRYLKDESLGKNAAKDWGNKVDKTLLITDAYFGQLRLLHEDINRYYGESNWGYFFNYEPVKNKYDYFTSEFGVLGEFEKYYSQIINVAKELCYVGETPSSEQMKMAEKEQEILLSSWASFRSRLEVISRFVIDANDVIGTTIGNDFDEDKPICEEYPTSLAGYSIIKCTNLP
jgi:hypothetical protein